MRHLSLITIVVPDYDAGIAYYRDVLGFELIEDTEMAPGKRWVVVSPGGQTRILLAQASGPDQIGAVGNQTGGRVGFFLHTDQFDQDYAEMAAKGVDFLEEPRSEVYGRVAKFRDGFGNLWDLLQFAKS